MTQHKEMNGMVPPGSARDRRGSSSGQPNCSGELPFPEQFGAIIERERARAERSTQIFALLVFDLAGHGAAFREQFVTAATRRIRFVDQAGWFRDNQLGLLLPHTDKAGAQKLADELSRSGASGTGGPPCAVYAYPYAWLPDGRGGVTSEADTIESGEGAERQGPRFENDQLFEGPNVFVLPTPRWKRAADIVLAGLAITVLSPLFVLLALFIKLVSEGPVFYRHLRVGREGRPYTCLKFRSMRAGGDSAIHRSHLEQLIRSNAPMKKLSGDPRVIFGGSLMRSLSLDELPQLVNVLRRDMSLVGPRPCLPYEADRFLRWHTRRFDATPGITGLWQVSGKNELNIDEMVRLDIAYISRISLVRDLAILAQTPFAILRQTWRDAKQD